jgi:hypothetical protein
MLRIKKGLNYTPDVMIVVLDDLPNMQVKRISLEHWLEKEGFEFAT